MVDELKREQQKSIIQILQVKTDFDPSKEVFTRIQFIKNQLEMTQRSVLVLGISGGIDSTVAGRLCQLVAQERRKENKKTTFIAMRLPYGLQHDEGDAQKAIEFINADEILTINMKPATDAILKSLLASKLSFKNDYHQDFVVGNIKARQRMVTQYAVAGARDGLVVGTDHAAEALMGFFTKFGDGACDITPLTGLNKRQVKGIGRYLGAPVTLVEKNPTADLETLSPLRPDEMALGVTYNEIDDFLEGKIVDDRVYDIIFKTYNATKHKRCLPFSP